MRWFLIPFVGVRMERQGRKDGVFTSKVDELSTLSLFHAQRRSKPAVVGLVYPTVLCTGKGIDNCHRLFSVRIVTHKIHVSYTTVIQFGNV